jgi:hypothetical protein
MVPNRSTAAAAHRSSLCKSINGTERAQHIRECLQSNVTTAYEGMRVRRQALTYDLAQNCILEAAARYAQVRQKFTHTVVRLTTLEDRNTVNNTSMKEMAAAVSAPMKMLITSAGRLWLVWWPPCGPLECPPCIALPRDECPLFVPLPKCECPPWWVPLSPGSRIGESREHSTRGRSTHAT